jgi:hypothetical protein
VSRSRASRAPAAAPSPVPNAVPAIPLLAAAWPGVCPPRAEA